MKTVTLATFKLSGKTPALKDKLTIADNGFGCMGCAMVQDLLFGHVKLFLKTREKSNIITYVMRPVSLLEVIVSSVLLFSQRNV